jgi:hypothetical protein
MRRDFAREIAPCAPAMRSRATLSVIAGPAADKRVPVRGLDTPIAPRSRRILSTAFA